MKPLNFKERNDKTFEFFVSFLITLAIAVCSIYFANHKLGEAIVQKETDHYEQYLSYQQHQKQYMLDITEINQMFSSPNLDGAIILKKILDFQSQAQQRNDTTRIMKKTIEVYNNSALAISEFNSASEKLRQFNRELQDCYKQIAKPSKPKQ